MITFIKGNCSSRIVLYLFFIFISLSANAQFTQHRLQGEWITYSDSSEHDTTYNKIFFRIVFKDNHFFTTTNYLINEELMDRGSFDTRGSSIGFVLNGNHFIFRIVSLTSDTLILKAHNHTLNLEVYYKMVRSAQLRAGNILSQAEKDTLIANKYVTPLLLKYYDLNENSKAYYSRKLKKFPEATCVIGRLIFNIKEQSVVTLIDTSNQDQEKTNFLVQYLDSTYSYWDLKDFQQCRFVCVPFRFITTRQFIPEKAGMYKVNRIYFSDIQKEMINKPTKDEKIKARAEEKAKEKAKEKFIKGVRFYEKKKYEKAQVAFEEALALYPDYRDALYDLGVVYYELGQQDKACECFNKLADMGDTEAKDILEKKFH